MSQFDPIIHQPARLRIMAVLTFLDQSEQADFSYLRALLKLTDGNLGAHLAKLEQAEYIKIEKTFVNKKPKTYLQTTGKGRDAFSDHIDALKSIIKNE